MIQFDYYKFLQSFSTEENTRVFENDMSKCNPKYLREPFKTFKLGSRNKFTDDRRDNKPYYYGIKPQLSGLPPKMFIDKHFGYYDMCPDVEDSDLYEFCINIEDIIYNFREQNKSTYFIFTDELSIIFGIILMLELSPIKSDDFKYYVLKKIIDSKFLYYISFGNSEPSEIYKYLVSFFKINEVNYKELLEIPTSSRITSQNYKPSEFVHENSAFKLADWKLDEIKFINQPSKEKYEPLINKLFNSEINIPAWLQIEYKTKAEIKSMVDEYFLYPVLKESHKRILINFAQRSFDDYVKDFYEFYNKRQYNPANIFPYLVFYFKYNALFLVFTREYKKEFKLKSDDHFLVDSPVMYVASRFKPW